MRVFPRTEFDSLLDCLRARGYRLVGPTVRDAAIVYEEIGRSSELPAGWGDSHEPGRYRLHRREDEALFGYTVGPQSWKKYLFPPTQTAFRVRRENGALHFAPASGTPPSYAFVGVRACELRALQIQDAVFLGGPHADEAYRARRERAFILAVNCGQAGGTCFCASMDAGPGVGEGYDLALTELLEPTHRFVARAGSDIGRAVLGEIESRSATEADRDAAAEVVERTSRQMGRELPSADLRELLNANMEHPRWDDVAARCMSCANCTLVCPTCFCSTVEDTATLTGEEAVRNRRWDSCFSAEFSYMSGGNVRQSVRGRYRQWLTHKMASWHDQFDTSGCVGCGRCITWCPVGIDITAEVKAIQGEVDR